MARKKKLEEDAWLWIHRPKLPGLSEVTGNAVHNQDMPTKPSSFIENYLYYFFLPTPFEQIGTLLDPLNLQTPHGRYRSAGGLPRLVMDIGGDVHMMRAAVDPGTLPMMEAYMQNPYNAAFGYPSLNYWTSPEGLAITEIFQEAGY